MQLELAQVLRAGQRDHTRVVRTGRQLREIDSVFVAEEELDTPNTGTGQRLGHGSSHALCLLEVLLRDGGHLETLAVITTLLYVADRRAEERRAIVLCHGQQRDLTIEADKLLDDQLHDVAARALATIIPRVLQVIGRVSHRLTLARGGHERFDHTRESDLLGSLFQFVETLGIEVFCRLEPQLLGGQVADRLAIHRVVYGACTRYDTNALLLEFVETLGADGLDLRNN